MIAVASFALAFPAMGAEPAFDSATRQGAKEAFRRGLTLVDDGRFEEAAIAFEEAYAAEPQRAVLYNIGQAHAAARHYARAADALARYLAGDRAELPPERVAEVAATLEQLAHRLGQLELTIAPAAADVRVDGQKVALEAGHALRLDPGNHIVSAVLDGYASTERRVHIAAEETRVLSLQLAPLAPAVGPNAPATARSVASVEHGELRSKPRSALPDAPRSSSHARRTWAAISAGGGLVLAAVTVGLIWDNQNRYDDWHQKQKELDQVWERTPAGEAGPKAQQQDNDERATRIKHIDQVSTGLAVGSGAMFGIAAILFFESNGGTAPRSSSWAVGAQGIRWRATW